MRDGKRRATAGIAKATDGRREADGVEAGLSMSEARLRALAAASANVVYADKGLGWTFSRAVPVLGADGDIVEWSGRQPT